MKIEKYFYSFVILYLHNLDVTKTYYLAYLDIVIIFEAGDD